MGENMPVNELNSSQHNVKHLDVLWKGLIYPKYLITMNVYIFKLKTIIPTVLKNFGSGEEGGESKNWPQKKFKDYKNICLIMGLTHSPSMRLPEDSFPVEIFYRWEVEF